MNLFTRPPQLTTAVTDLMIGIFAAYFIIRMKGISEPRKRRKTIWKAFMWTMLASGLGGFFIHGFRISDRVVAFAWFLLIFIMFATASTYAMAVLYELLEDAKLKKMVYILIVLNMAGYIVTLIASRYTSKFLAVFVIYAGILMLASLVLLAFMIIKRKAYYCLYLMAGAVLQVAGGVVEACRTARFTLIWEFDFNSIYHLATVASIIFFLMAYKAGALLYCRKNIVYAANNKEEGIGC